jgi:hypothetical protein
MQTELHYTQLPTDPITENWDLSAFTEQQLQDFYWGRDSINYKTNNLKRR